MYQVIVYLEQDRPTTVVLVQGGAKISIPGVVEEGDQIIVNIDDMTYQGKAIGVTQ